MKQWVPEGVNKHSQSVIDILAMRQRLVHLQATLAYESARARQLEAFLRGNGDVLEE